jgi:hypothetical protein
MRNRCYDGAFLGREVLEDLGEKLGRKACTEGDRVSTMYSEVENLSDRQYFVVPGSSRRDEGMSVRNCACSAVEKGYPFTETSKAKSNNVCKLGFSACNMAIGKTHWELATMSLAYVSVDIEIYKEEDKAEIIYHYKTAMGDVYIHTTVRRAMIVGVSLSLKS